MTGLLYTFTNRDARLGNLTSSHLKWESGLVVLTIAPRGRNNYNLRVEAECLPNLPIRNYGATATVVRGDHVVADHFVKGYGVRKSSGLANWEKEEFAQMEKSPLAIHTVLYAVR